MVDIEIQRRQERIQLETLRHRITGAVTLQADGYRSRLSDQLNTSERDFLVLTDATIEPVDGGAPSTHDFIAVARTQIVYVVSLPDAGADSAFASG